MKLIDQYISYIELELNYSKLTVQAYRGDLLAWEQWAAGASGRPLDVASVTVADVRAWVMHLAAHGLSARSLRRKVQSLRSFYKWLMRQGLAAANPAQEVQLARVPKRLPAVARPQQVDEAIASAPGLAPAAGGEQQQVRDELMVMMLYDTGMRRAELIGLLDADVDTQAMQLRVHGKRDKDRIVPIGPELAQAIGRYRQLRTPPARGTFFVTLKGEPLYPAAVYRVVHRALRQAGVQGKASPHVLRHSFASAMLNSGAQLGSVKDLLGHESLATTQIYTHITFSELKNNYKQAHPRALKKGGYYGNQN